MSKLFTIADLQYLNLAQLQALYQRVNQELTCSAKNSPERSAALANLEALSRMIAQRRTFSGPRF